MTEDESMHEISQGEASNSASGESKGSPFLAQESGMCRADYLLSHLLQECCEVAIRCTKAQMFGLDEIQPEQEFSNRQRILHELCDMLAIGEELRDLNILPSSLMYGDEMTKRIAAKKLKALHFRDYSVKLGRLTSAVSEDNNVNTASSLQPSPKSETLRDFLLRLGDDPTESVATLQQLFERWWANEDSGDRTQCERAYNFGRACGLGDAEGLQQTLETVTKERDTLAEELERLTG